MAVSAVTSPPPSSSACCRLRPPNKSVCRVLRCAYHSSLFSKRPLQCGSPDGWQGNGKVWLAREPGQPAPQRWHQGPCQLPKEGVVLVAPQQAPHTCLATGAWHVPPLAGGPGHQSAHLRVALWH